jgi:hypothetical protein
MSLYTDLYLFNYTKNMFIWYKIGIIFILILYLVKKILFLLHQIRFLK